MKVRATEASQKLSVRIKDLNRIVQPGEIFEVSEARFNVLHGHNKFGVVFVEKVDVEPAPNVEKTVVKPAEEVVEEKPEIIIIEPGKEPVKVNEKLEEEKPKVEKKVTKKKTTTKVEATNTETAKKTTKKKTTTVEK